MNSKLGKKCLQLCGMLFITFVVYIIAAADHNALPTAISRVYAFPFGDKVGHVVFYGTLAFFANYLLHPRALRLANRTVQYGTLILFILITIEEFSQAFVASRTFDLIDLACSYLGLFAGAVAAKYLSRSTTAQ